MGLDTVELLLAFEEEFDIEFSDEVAGELTTVRDVRDFLVSEHQRLGRAADPQDIFVRIAKVTHRLVGGAPERITLDAAFVEDLRMD
jgi:acyl carrier protein